MPSHISCHSWRCAGVVLLALALALISGACAPKVVEPTATLVPTTAALPTQAAEAAATSEASSATVSPIVEAPTATPAPPTEPPSVTAEPATEAVSATPEAADESAGAASEATVETGSGQTEDEALQEGRSSGGFAAGNVEQDNHSINVPTLLPGKTDFRVLANPTVDPALVDIPNLIPHSLNDVDRSDCLVCHGTGIGGSPLLPVDHFDSAIPSSLCQACHVPGPSSFATMTAQPPAPTTAPG